jgi:predicted alpha/beta superfamily hydrolase
MPCNKLSNISIVLFIWLLCGSNMTGQVNLLVEGLPENTPSTDDIYVSGDFEGWTGGQDAYRLAFDQGQHKIILPGSKETIHFKFTRGSWESVESDTEGRQLDNRSFSFTKKMDTLKVNIAQWADLTPKKSTASSRVHLLDNSFDMSPLDKKRRVWIYLPASYDTSSKNYPVVYMHDGQNLFDQSLSYSGEWEVDETLDRLENSHELELIIVGIDNGGSERIDEYTPWEIPEYPSKQQGDTYIRFIKENLKPFIDKNYRTQSNSEQTAIMGSSLGGLISYYAALQYPETFGKAGIFSPSFEMVKKSLDFAKDHGNLKDSKIYFMAGNKESEQMVAKMSQTIQVMIAAGFPENNIKSKVVKEGEHNEKLWREEFEPAIIWLFETGQ